MASEEGSPWTYSLTFNSGTTYTVPAISWISDTSTYSATGSGGIYYDPPSDPYITATWRFNGYSTMPTMEIKEVIDALKDHPKKKDNPTLHDIVDALIIKEE